MNTKTNMSWKSIIKLVLISASCISLVALITENSAWGQSPTAFTYQGYMRDTSTNANGPYTNVFTLYDSITDGNQIGDAISNVTTPANGYFTTVLDFGAQTFLTNAGPYWLDVQIDGETLSPRQRITPVPLASLAFNVASNSNATVGGETNLKIIRGSINRDGTIAAGSGFASSLVLTNVNDNSWYFGHVSLFGYYCVNFLQSFASQPSVTISGAANWFYSLTSDDTESMPGRATVLQSSPSGFVVGDALPLNTIFTNAFVTNSVYGNPGWMELGTYPSGTIITNLPPTLDFIAIGPQ
jgi:hypothetical protein